MLGFAIGVAICAAVSVVVDFWPRVKPWMSKKFDADWWGGYV